MEMIVKDKSTLLDRTGSLEMKSSAELEGKLLSF